MDADLRRFVRERARNRCEYCGIHQDQDAFFTFPVDHIIALQHSGKTDATNLCLSCYRCNSHKGPNIASIDPVLLEQLDDSRLLVTLNPASDRDGQQYQRLDRGA